MSNLVSNLPQSPDIDENLEEDISDFQISGQSLIKENRHNSRTSDDIDMKFGPVTKTTETEQLQKNLTITSRQQIVKSLPFFKLSNLCQIYIFFNSSLLSYKR